MVSVRATVLLAITAAMSARAYSYSDAIEALAARAISNDYEGLSAREHAPSANHYIARTYADDGMGILARDLTELGIRSEDISHILVVRAGRSPSPRGRGSRPPSPKGMSKAECEKQIADRKKWLKDVKAKIKAKLAEIKKEKNPDRKERLKDDLGELNGLRDQYEEDLEAYEKMLPTLH